MVDLQVRGAFAPGGVESPRVGDGVRQVPDNDSALVGWRGLALPEDGDVEIDDVAGRYGAVRRACAGIPAQADGGVGERVARHRGDEDCREREDFRSHWILPLGRGTGAAPNRGCK